VIKESFEAIEREAKRVGLTINKRKTKVLILEENLEKNI